MATLITFAVVTQAAGAGTTSATQVITPDLRRLLDAIRQVETGGIADPSKAVGDGGASLGPYQIQRAYWRDSGVPGRYEQVRDRAYAERVMLAYWQRHCKHALADGNLEWLARVHNGGPRAPLRPSATNGYWTKVNREMRKQEKKRHARTTKH